MARRTRARRSWRLLGTAGMAMACALSSPGFAVAQEGPSVPLHATVSGANGAGNIEAPGRSCLEGGSGAYWNYDYTSTVPGGVFSSQPGDLRLHLALHSDAVRFPNTQDPLPAGGPRAFLQGSDSHATVANSRGAVLLRLQSGDCGAPTLTFDGVSTAGTGTWQLASGDGSYRDASGSGTFAVTADVAPGADNPFTLQLDGDVSVLQPSLKVDVLSTYWGSLGTDYLSRRVTVVYRVTNTGPGDAFAAKVASITSPTPGVTPIGGTNLRLGDLPAGESEVVQLRFQLGLLSPCTLVILGCQFTTETKVDWADALDIVSTPMAQNSAKAPILPPPL